MSVVAIIVGGSVRGALGTLCVAALLAGSPALAQQVQPPATVPVTVTSAVRQDVPFWLRGLGTVQANYSVQLRPRVDGTLMKVAVNEGQDVKQGDLLAIIDPRPIRRLWMRSLAKKQQDQAQLSNAQADLSRYTLLVRKDFASRQQLETQQALVKQIRRGHAWRRRADRGRATQPELLLHHRAVRRPHRAAQR